MASTNAKAKQRLTATAQPAREVMDIRQAADFLGISADSLYKYASEGIIPAFRLGNRWRFQRTRLLDWMDKESVQPKEKKPAGRAE